MDAFTSRGLAERIGIGKDLAARILALPTAPDPAKFLTPEGYLRKLAKAAIKAGHQHDALAALALSVGPRRAEVPDPPEPSGEAAPAPSPAQAPAHAHDGDVTAEDLQTAGTVLRGIVEGLGQAIGKALKSKKDAADAIPLLDKFRALQGEFRQTVEQLEEIRQQHLELLPRADVYAAAGRLFQVVRGMADAWTNDLLTAGNLPSWIATAGGVFPESAQARQHVRMALRNYASSHYNQLAEALGDMAVPVEDVEPELADELRQEMAGELERQAAVLRRPRIGTGKGVDA